MSSVTASTIVRTFFEHQEEKKETSTLPKQTKKTTLVAVPRMVHIDRFTLPYKSPIIIGEAAQKGMRLRNYLTADTTSKKVVKESIAQNNLQAGGSSIAETKRIFAS